MPCSVPPSFGVSPPLLPGVVPDDGVFPPLFSSLLHPTKAMAPAPTPVAAATCIALRRLTRCDVYFAQNVDVDMDNPPWCGLPALMGISLLRET